MPLRTPVKFHHSTPVEILGATALLVWVAGCGGCGGDGDALENDQYDWGEPRDDGAACSVDAECHSDVCYQGRRWPDGHCTTTGCTEDSDCHGDDAVCVPIRQDDNFCGRGCEPLADWDNQRLTSGQSRVLQVNPLTRP